MRLLTDEEINLIRSDLTGRGITLSGLSVDLLDHLICSTEHYLSEEHLFAEAYQLALRDLQGGEGMECIQQETLRAVEAGKSFSKNLLVYCCVPGLLLLLLALFPQVAGPGLILPAISLLLFFVYHSIFYFRTQKDTGRNLRLFLLLTALPATGVMSVVGSTPGFQWLGTKGWCLLLILSATGLYYYSVQRVLSEPRTLRQLLIQITRFLAMAGLLWIPLALSLKLFKPGVAVFFFLDDLLILSLTGLICLFSLQSTPARVFFRRHFRRGISG
jgi:hypothetical protein